MKLYKNPELTRKEIGILIYFFDKGIVMEEYYNKKLEVSTKNKVDKIRDKLYELKEEMKND
jgi:hypothetical protein